jgi:hypothetical protein
VAAEDSASNPAGGHPSGEGSLAQESAAAFFCRNRQKLAN